MAKISAMLLLLTVNSFAFSAPPPFADIDLHFNWDQKEVISAREIINRLKENNVVLAAASTTPTHLALELAHAGGSWLQAFFSPYITAGHRDRWFLDESVLLEAEKGLSSDLYSGIGELHVSADFGPRRDNRILTGLLKLAEKYQVPFLIHTEASSHLFLTPVCRAYPEVRFLWAHAGGKLPPKSIDQLMQQCPNVQLEVSVRDP